MERRDAIGEYQRLLARLATRARWMGSTDPEGAAQEALKRALQHSEASRAVTFYFADTSSTPDDGLWPLSQLLAWLHGVLNFVVKEERNRGSRRREVRSGDSPEGKKVGETPDTTPSALDSLIQEELKQIVADCLPHLDADYRKVLALRARGLKYSEISTELGVPENTVATWVSRGVKVLAASVKERTTLGALKSKAQHG